MVSKRKGAAADMVHDGTLPREFSSGAARALLLHDPLAGRGQAAPVYVGLTGGIGSGKTTVARAWSGAGATVISADELARQVVEPGSEGLNALVEAFGHGILDDEGSLDRAGLAKIMFEDPDARRLVEAITHPLIGERALQLRAQASSRVVVYDVPLLVEGNMSAQFDVVAVVDAPVAVRLQRLEGRGLSRTEAERRMASQATHEQRLAAADIWLDNAGNVADLEAVARAAYVAWL